MLGELLSSILGIGRTTGIIAHPDFPLSQKSESENPEKKFQDKVDSLTDFDNDRVDEAYLKKLARKLGVQSITIVSLSHAKDYQVEFYTSDSQNAKITTKNNFSRNLYVGQKITAS